jgi:hypothetical protein
MAWHRCEPVKCMLSPFAGAMNLHTSSNPSVRTPELMATLVCVDPELYGRRFDCSQVLGIENEKAWVGRTIVVQLRVQHSWAVAADNFVTVDRKLTGRHDARLATSFAYVLLRCRGCRADACAHQHGGQNGPCRQACSMQPNTSTCHASPPVDSQAACFSMNLTALPIAWTARRHRECRNRTLPRSPSQGLSCRGSLRLGYH